MKFSTTLTAAALVLALPAVASAAFKGHIKPKKDDRCLSKISGGVGLESCGSENKVKFQDPGKISFGNKCIFVQISDGQGSNPWKSGTRLMIRKCSDPEVPSSHGKWVYDDDSKKIRAKAKSNKCLSIEGANRGNLRGVIKKCSESGVTKWKLKD